MEKDEVSERKNRKYNDKNNQSKKTKSVSLDNKGET